MTPKESELRKILDRIDNTSTGYISTESMDEVVATILKSWVPRDEHKILNNHLFRLEETISKQRLEIDGRKNQYKLVKEIQQTLETKLDKSRSLLKEAVNQLEWYEYVSNQKQSQDLLTKIKKELGA